MTDCKLPTAPFLWLFPFQPLCHPSVSLPLGRLESLGQYVLPLYAIDLFILFVEFLVALTCIFAGVCL
ncbi:Uncharacterized protein TCM_042173 [Theobroma cacao]|uniref:Uncharacterized protein n=1 Tax=Theobroma cacao TaxID=3641 RepID=A0A061GXE2_THECC|nr:Uncharacterized protein TCM_042173 [Theobroma cacao]